MKKTSNLFIILIMLIVFVGCTTNRTVNEDFSDKYYKNFSEVKNIAYYLKLNKDNLTVLSENESSLIFCFAVDDELDLHDESILSYANYVKELEAEGYQLTVLDATISQTLKLDNNKYTISVTIISDMDEFKKAHKDIANINKITSENILYELIKRRSKS